MTGEQHKEMANRLNELYRKLDSIRVSVELGQPVRATSEQLYGEMVNLERRLFGTGYHDE